MRFMNFLYIFCALLLLSSGVSAVSAEDGYTYVTQWGNPGFEAGHLNQPNGIAVDSAGTVYVADTGNNWIQKFDASGALLLK